MKETPKEQTKSKFVADNVLPQIEGTTVIFREGPAPKLLDPIKPNKVELNGVITAPSEFYKKRKDLHDPNKCHIVFDRHKGTITLVVDEQFANDNYKVSGQVTYNPDLLEFQINAKNKTFSIKELLDTLKFRRMFFAEKSVNEKIVTSLYNFKGKIEKTIEETTDLRGNDTKVKITTLTHDLEKDFILSMPVYKGGSPMDFRVEICIEATSGDVRVWLESKELKEIEQKSLDLIIDAELEHFKEIVCIEQ